VDDAIAAKNQIGFGQRIVDHIKLNKSTVPPRVQASVAAHQFGNNISANVFD